MPVDLHFICPHQDHWARLEKSSLKREIGRLPSKTIAEQTAEQALGGRIYLHERKRAPAWHGGTITRWRRADEPGRPIFTHVVDGPFRVTCADGWGQEKAIVRR